MIINNSLISSLESLKSNFDFIEIWNKRDIAIRDLSPRLIYYADKGEKDLYEVLAHPENVVKENDELIYRHKEKEIILKLDTNNALLEKYSFPQRLQIIALHKLVKLPISKSVTEAIADIDIYSSKIVLENGKWLKFGKNNDINNTLEYKPIFVSETSRKQSKVGDYSLEPGQVTFGIFCGAVLIDAAPPYATNSSYHVEYELINDKISLIVTDNATNRHVKKYDNAHYFAMLGDNDLIVIDGLIVSCLNNEDLNNRLRNIIVKAKFPQIIKIEKDTIRVIYKDFTEELIKI